MSEPCRSCGGEGRASATETVAVKVPPGVAHGNYIPLRGLGDAGPRGGAAGDLIVIIEEKPHDVFDRRGDDLSVEVPLAFTTAALGGKLDVPLLGGGTSSVDVPAGTQSGHVVRIRGKGLPSLRGSRGDLLARLRVWVPQKLSSGERKLLEELRKQGGLTTPVAGKSVFEKVRDAFAG